MFFSSGEIRKSAEIFADIEALPARLDGACLFGAGAVGRSLLWSFRRRGVRAGRFVDNNPSLWGKNVDGAVVLSLDEHAAAHRDK